MLSVVPTDCVGRSLFQAKDDLVAQLVEQYTFNVWVLGSSPSGVTLNKPKLLEMSFLGFIFYKQADAIADEL